MVSAAAQGPVLTDSPQENEAANSIPVPLLALVLLLNHVVYKNIPALMDNMYYPSRRTLSRCVMESWLERLPLNATEPHDARVPASLPGRPRSTLKVSLIPIAAAAMAA